MIIGGSTVAFQENAAITLNFRPCLSPTLWPSGPRTRRRFSSVHQITHCDETPQNDKHKTKVCTQQIALLRRTFPEILFSEVPISHTSPTTSKKWKNKAHGGKCRSKRGIKMKLVDVPWIILKLSNNGKTTALILFPTRGSTNINFINP